MTFLSLSQNPQPQKIIIFVIIKNNWKMLQTLQFYLPGEYVPSSSSLKVEVRGHAALFGDWR
jgi:hypothetical protein